MKQCWARREGEAADTTPEFEALDNDSLNFSLRDFVVHPIVKFGRPGRGMIGNSLGALDRTTVFAEYGNACTSKCMAASGGG